MHAGVGLPGVRAHGIEYVASRAQVAAAALAQLRGQGAAAALALSGVSLACGDATVDLGASIAFSHVYIYDKVPGPLDSASRCTHTVPRWYKIASRLNGEASNRILGIVSSKTHPLLPAFVRPTFGKLVN